MPSIYFPQSGSRRLQLHLLYTRLYFTEVVDHMLVQFSYICSHSYLACGMFPPRYVMYISSYICCILIFYHVNNYSIDKCPFSVLVNLILGILYMAY